jgi:hypothetical protein
MCDASREAQHFSSKTDSSIGSVMPAPGANGARPFSSGKRARKIGKHVRLIVLSLRVMLLRGNIISLEKGPTIVMRKDEGGDYRSISAPNDRLLGFYLDIWHLESFYVMLQS